MPLHSIGKSLKTVERPGINWRETSLESSSLILSVVKEAAMLAPNEILKKAACKALVVFETTQVRTRKKINGTRISRTEFTVCTVDD